jgi:hypothetical protein
VRRPLLHQPATFAMRAPEILDREASHVGDSRSHSTESDCSRSITAVRM